MLIIYAHCCALVCSSVLAVCQRAHEFLMKSENAEEAVVGLTSLTASLPGTTPGTAWVPLNTKLENPFQRMNILVYWSSFLVLWTILELSIEFYMYFHKLSRPTPPHQVADSQ